MRERGEAPLKQFKNQSGLTLIELLATITITSILSILIYNIFITGLLASLTAENTASLQQEANYLVTFIDDYHKRNESYTITIDENHKKITFTNIVTFETEVINNSRFLYDIYDTKNNVNALHTIQIDSANKNFHIQLIVKSEKSPKTYEINTIISRL